MASSIEDRHRRFIEEYPLDWNATQAAIRAGYEAKHAHDAGWRLLRNTEVRRKLNAHLKELGERVCIEKQKIILQAERLAHFDIRELFRPDGSLKPAEEWDEALAAAVLSVETEELFEGSGEERRQIGYTKKVKVGNRLQALELLAKFAGMDPRLKFEKAEAQRKQDEDDDYRLVRDAASAERDGKEADRPGTAGTPASQG